MRQELTIRVAGQAGQGIQTIGAAMCKIFAESGLNIFAYQDYMSRIRGGNNFFQARVSEKPVYAPRRLADIIIALDKASVELHKQALAGGGILLADGGAAESAMRADGSLAVPFSGLAKEAGGTDVLINAVACGVMSEMAGIDLPHVESSLEYIFRDKNREIISKNLFAAKLGYDYAKNNAALGGFVLVPVKPETAIVWDGNSAVALGALRAGCKFYSAYPMSPSTGIMEYMARYGKAFSVIVEQAEDEIAAVNMAIGASFAGARAMTATSGGGFALMTEGLSLAAMTETPLVIVDAQRPGPATGFPTRTEQADIEFIIHAGHGEFARAVFTPGTPEEAFLSTVRAFNLAERYRLPVLILSDQYLAESSYSAALPDFDKAVVARHRISKTAGAAIKGYKHYDLGGPEIAPFAAPSFVEDVIYADSDEHSQEGHITESAAVRERMVKRRFHDKMAALRREITSPVFFNTEDADIVLVGCGSVYGAIKEAAQIQGTAKVGFVHLPQIWPFPSEAVIPLLKTAKKTLTVENNASAQLARLLFRETGIKVSGSILKFDGRPFDIENVFENLENGSY